MDRLDTLLQFLQESPEDNFLLFALAKEYEKREEDDQALAHYERLQQINENYIGLYYHLGKLWERRGEPARAFAVYTKGMEKAQRAGEKHALSELAGARLALGDEEDFC